MSELTNDSRLGYLINIVERIVEEKHGGMVMLLKSETGWRAMFVFDRVRQHDIKPAATAEAALIDLLARTSRDDEATAGG